MPTSYLAAQDGDSQMDHALPVGTLNPSSGDGRVVRRRRQKIGLVNLPRMYKDGER